MTIQQFFRVLAWSVVYLVVFAGGFWASDAAAQQTTFKDDVFPIIQIRCLECHQPGGEGYEASGLDLRTYESLMKGTKYGPIITPRSAATSNLFAAIEHTTDPAIQMPHNRKKLSKCERQTFRAWINQGAKNN